MALTSRCRCWRCRPHARRFDAAIPGLLQPRIEALLRSLPKEARRGLIPIAATAAEFLAHVARSRGTNLERLAHGCMKRAASREHLIRFDAGAPATSSRALAVIEDGRVARAAEQTSRICAGAAPCAARAELDARARRPPIPRRGAASKSNELPDRAAARLDRGDGRGLSDARAGARPRRGALRMVARRRLHARFAQGAVHLARTVLGAPGARSCQEHRRECCRCC